MDRSSWEKEASRMITNYESMRTKNPNSSMYEEAMWQYAEMAHGGDGGPSGSSDGDTIRSEYYPNHPNEFFFLVLSGLGEFERYMKCASSPIGIP